MTNKNIVRLNSFSFALFGFAFQPENIFKSQFDMRTVIAVVVILFMTAAVLAVYNRIKKRSENLLKSKLSSR